MAPSEQGICSSRDQHLLMFVIKVSMVPLVPQWAMVISPRCASEMLLILDDRPSTGLLLRCRCFGPAAASTGSLADVKA